MGPPSAVDHDRAGRQRRRPAVVDVLDLQPQTVGSVDREVERVAAGAVERAAALELGVVAGDDEPVVVRRPEDGPVRAEPDPRLAGRERRVLLVAGPEDDLPVAEPAAAARPAAGAVDDDEPRAR